MMTVDPEEKLFSLEDIARLFRKQKKRFIRAALLGCAVAFLSILVKPVKYKAEATFKESAERKGGEGFLGLISHLSTAADAPQASALLQSNLVLKPLVSKFALQIAPVSAGLLGKAWKRIADNCKIIRGCKLDEVDPFRFSDLLYDGEEQKSFQLCFRTREEFDVVSKAGTAEGRVGVRVALDDGVSFCLVRPPKSLKLGQRYAFLISPWVSSVKLLKDSLEVVSHKSNKSIYDLFFRHRDRHLAAEILNELMVCYQRYLKDDHDQVAEAQIQYLAKRQNDVFEMLQEVVNEHTGYLRRSLDKSGFMNLEEESKLSSKPYERLYQQSFDAELELQQLASSRNGSGAMRDVFGARAEQLQGAIQGLESQRDLIQSSLCFREKENRALGEDFLDRSCRDLVLIRKDLDVAKSALAAMETDGNLPYRLELQYDPNRIVASWAQRIDDGLQDKNDLRLYLHNLVRLFSVREKILQERQLHGNGFPELEGIDLETAKQLLIATSRKLDEVKAAMERYRHFSAKLEDASFEISSLGTIFSDPVSQKLLERAADLHLSLEDEETHSEKEAERYRREIALLRRTLGDHLQQMYAVEELNSSLCQDKIAALQQVSLDAIERQISVNEEKISDLTRQRKEDLLIQKDLLENKMKGLQAQMASNLPDRWRAEQLLEFKEKMGIKMLESIGQLVESKTIGHHLHHVESKPLDCALAPFVPEQPRLALLAAAGALIGGFGTFFLSFLRTFYRGFPASADKLLALRYPFSGQISFSTDGPEVEQICDGDLETLRRWILQIDASPKAKILALLGAAGPDYSYSLAKLLAQSRRKILLLRCDFSSPFSQEGVPGLLQVLRGSSDSLPIRRDEDGGYDLMSTGGYTRYGTELIRSLLFEELLERLGNSYDHVLLFSRAPLNSAEAEALLRICDKAAATFSEEPIELLTPLMRWAYHEGRTRLTFLASSNSL